MRTTTGDGAAGDSRPRACVRRGARARIPSGSSPIHPHASSPGGPWSSARPVPPRSPSLPARSAKPAGKHGPATRLQLPSQALRARHQRADARPDEPVPLRRARHLPADDHARGARQQQEGHDRSRAQRAPGESRFLDELVTAHAETASPTASRSTGKSGGAATGKPLPADRGDHDDAARLARQRQGRQPDPRRRDAPARSAAQAPA